MAVAGPMHTTTSDEAAIDLDRARRCGYPEVVFGSGKSPEALVRISQQLNTAQQPVLITRIDEDKAAHLAEHLPEGRFNPVARTWRWDGDWSMARCGRAGVVSAGTSDQPVAEEARETLDWMGVEATLIADVGVAGPHRFPARLGELDGCDVIVVAAGMEGGAAKRRGRLC